MTCIIVKFDKIPVTDRSAERISSVSTNVDPDLEPDSEEETVDAELKKNAENGIQDGHDEKNTTNEEKAIADVEKPNQEKIEEIDGKNPQIFEEAVTPEKNINELKSEMKTIIREEPPPKRIKT